MLENKINGKIYIGQTIRAIDVRFKEHQLESSTCVAIRNAIQYHGWENFEKDYYECPDEDLNFDEELLVREMGTLAPNGYNLQDGGGNCQPSEESKQKNRDSHLGKAHNEESKKKMSKVRQGKMHTEGTKKKIGESRRGKTHTKETRQKMAETQRGKTHSEETKLKMRNVKIGKKIFEETKQKLSDSQRGEKHHNSKRVYQYDLLGKLLGSFGSVREAGRYLNKDVSGISRCASNDRKIAYGFKWSYVLHHH